MNRKHPLLLALSAAMVMGTSAPAFAAEATDAATREDVISLLWQQEGAPVINYALPFTDVADTAADAVRWAAEAKIVSGYGNGKFEPNQKITREQLEEIAKIKMNDLNATTMEAAVKMIAGSCRAMGVTVKE